MHLEGIIGEVRIALVLRHPFGIDIAIVARLDVVVAFIAIAHVAQADRAGHVLQLAVAIGGTGQTIQRMVGDIELHHALADVLQSRCLGVDREAGRDGRGAGGGCTVAAFDLHETETAGAEGIDHVGGAELRHLNAGLHRGAHDRSALRHGDFVAVDGERHHLFSAGGRGTEVDFMDEGHGDHSAASTRGVGRKSSGKWFMALMTG